MSLRPIPSDAPFSVEQRQWLDGFLAGLQSGGLIANSAAAPGAANAEVRPLHVLYGTQTGNAEGLAHDCATLAKTRGLSPNVA